MSRSLLFSLALAACTNTHAGPGTGAGSGSGSGSGNGAFTLDKAGFYDDGTRFWSATSGPTLAGSIREPGALHAFIGDHQVGGDAMIDGDRWTLPLPDGTIGLDDTPIVLRLGSAEIVQLFAVDDTPPTIAFHATIADERLDTINDATGVPVHVHDGAPIQLGAGCPDVFKYAYLMDSTPPLFGSEATPNPLAFGVQLDAGAIADPATAMVRVRTGTGTVLADWSPLPGLDANGAATVTLFRDKLPPLGALTTEMHLEVQVADFLGRTSMADVCWRNHPLAAPLEVTPALQAATGPDAIATWSLIANSPVSRLLQPSLRPGQMLQEKLVQLTHEAVTIDVAFAAPKLAYTRTAVNDVMPPTATPATLYCGTTCNAGATNACVPDPVDDPRCKTGAPIDPPDLTASGDVATGAWHISVVDPAGAVASECAAISATEQRCTIPARGIGEGPQAFTVIAAVDNIAELRPAGLGPFGEFSLLGLTYTGLAPTSTTRCGHMVASTPDVDGSVTHTCTQLLTYAQVVALDHAALTATGGGLHVTAATTATGTLEDVAYLAHGTASNAVFTWDSGVDDLPGPAH